MRVRRELVPDPAFLRLDPPHAGYASPAWQPIELIITPRQPGEHPWVGALRPSSLSSGCDVRWPASALTPPELNNAPSWPFPPWMAFTLAWRRYGNGRTHGSLPTLCLCPPGTTLPYSSTSSPAWLVVVACGDPSVAGLPIDFLSAFFLLVERENRLVIKTRDQSRRGDGLGRVGRGT